MKLKGFNGNSGISKFLPVNVECPVLTSRVVSEKKSSPALLRIWCAPDPPAAIWQANPGIPGTIAGCNRAFPGYDKHSLEFGILTSNY